MPVAIVVGTVEGWDHEDIGIGKYRGFHTSYSAHNKEIDELKSGGIQMWYDSIGILHIKRGPFLDRNVQCEGH